MDIYSNSDLLFEKYENNCPEWEPNHYEYVNQYATREVKIQKNYNKTYVGKSRPYPFIVPDIGWTHVQQCTVIKTDKLICR